MKYPLRGFQCRRQHFRAAGKLNACTRVKGAIDRNQGRFICTIKIVQTQLVIDAHDKRTMW